MENIQVNLLDNQTKKEKDEILTKFILTLTKDFFNKFIMPSLKNTNN